MCDDDPQVVRALRVILRGAGYDVSTTATLAEGLDVAAREPLDAAIIDVVLPDGSGIELCSQLRSWSTMPIVVLSALDEEEQKVLALRAGADDYVTKPFSGRELLARMDAVFRRVSSDDEATITVKGLEINFTAHTVLRDGREVKLTPIEFKLLSALARNRGRVMSARALLRDVWGPTYANDSALLRTHIANLRHKIDGANSPSRSYIQTEAGVGYRFPE